MLNMQCIYVISSNIQDTFPFILFLSILNVKKQAKVDRIVMSIWHYVQTSIILTLKYLIVSLKFCKENSSTKMKKTSKEKLMPWNAITFFSAYNLIKIIFPHIYIYAMHFSWIMTMTILLWILTVTEICLKLFLTRFITFHYFHCNLK